MSEGLRKVSFPVAGMSCAAYALHYDESRVSSEQLKGAIEEAGYTVAA